MKRRARLRPRGSLVRSCDAPSAPARIDDRPIDPGGALAAADDSAEAAGAMVAADAACTADGRFVDLLVGDGGISVAAGVAAGVARAAADHGPALRALRTARARRLAIALGLARAARPG